jgi:hypothetical protein
MYHIETPPVESLEEQMRRIADKAITAIKQALAQPVQEPVLKDSSNYRYDPPVAEPVATLFGSLPVYDTTPPAQPAPAQPVGWLEILRNNKTATDEVIGAFLRGHAEHLTGETFVLTTPPAAQPAVPDALTSADIQEHIEYVAGWNDCRQAVLEMMK